MKTRKIWFLLVVLLLVGAACIGLAIKAVMPNAVVLDIPDVTKPWTYTFKDYLHTDLYTAGEFSIHVQGEIDGEATVHYYASYAGAIPLTSGVVDSVFLIDEAWVNKCKVEYIPVNVTHGNLAIRVGLGTNAELYGQKNDIRKMKR